MKNKRIYPRADPSDMIGKKFGKMTVISILDSTFGKVKYLCRCDCGSESPRGRAYLRSKGYEAKCARCRNPAGRALTHGMKHSREYSIWSNMKRRCHNKTNPSYPRYGGKGIRVCEAWRESFEAFFADMGPPPTAKHSLDRIDGKSGYSKDNCRWATATQQAANRKGVTMVTIKGERVALKHACRILNKSYFMVKKGIAAGHTPESSIRFTSLPYGEGRR